MDNSTKYPFVVHFHKQIDPGADEEGIKDGSEQSDGQQEK